MFRGRRGGYGGPRGVDYYVVLLFAQLAQQVARMENKPPITLALIAGGPGRRGVRMQRMARPLAQTFPGACTRPAKAD